MEEFDDLINKICNSSSSLSHRQYAEQRLMEILSDRSQWKKYTTLLLQANDTVCFFICIGFQKLTWKHWRDISVEDKMILNQTVTQALLSRPNLETFARSKMEQVLAAICANSCSLDPALAILKESDHPENFVGISAMRTVLELVLSDDPKLILDYKAPLYAATHDILLPLTNLSCQACTLALQSWSEAGSNTMLVALELLKVIITKLQIGSHVSFDVVSLLFTIAEFGASKCSGIAGAGDGASKLFTKAAMSAIEVLTDIMGKRYLPPGRPSTDAAADSGSDSAMEMLMEIVGKSVSLLKKFSSGGTIDDSPIVLSLLEFISVFSESHLERCINISNFKSTGSLGGQSSAISQHLSEFFEELVDISSSAMEPQLLHKVVTVWNRVISLGLVKDMLLANSSICLRIVSHLLQACLCQTNNHLQDGIEELIEDFKVVTLVDPRVKSILSHITERKEASASRHTSDVPSTADSTNSLPQGKKQQKQIDEVHGAEEYGYIGSSVLEDVLEFFLELVNSADVVQWLNSSVSQLVVQNIEKLSSTASQGNAAHEDLLVSSVDLQFLIRILPIITQEPAHLLGQLITLTVQLIESNMHGHLRNYAPSFKSVQVLEITCCQIAGQLLHSSRINGFMPADGADISVERIAFLESIFVQLVRGLNAVADPTFETSTSCPYPALAAFTILFMQAVSTFADLWGDSVKSMGDIKIGIEQTLLKLLADPVASSLPIEVYVLLVCAQDSIEPNSAAPMLVNRSIELVGVVERAVQANMPIELVLVDQIIHTIGAMDAIARYHSTSKPQRRQVLVAELAPLQNAMGRFATSLFRALIIAYSFEHNVNSNINSSSTVAPSKDVCFLCKLIVTLSSALLQSLGKKHFGKAAGEVLTVCVDFAENIAQMTFCSQSLPQQQVGVILDDGNTAGGAETVSLSKALFQQNGLVLLKHMLELAQVLAESTGSNASSANAQAMTTHRLIGFIIQGLNDERVCAELLHSTLKTGVTAIGCYWQKTQKVLPFLASINPNSSNDPSNQQAALPDINGENVRPIVLLLTQLCVGSLSPTVPPHDTLAALEGLLQLCEQHKLFSMTWFQNQCWGSLFTPCLRAMLLRIHNMHRSTLEQVLVALATAGEASYTSDVNIRSRSLSGENHGTPNRNSFGSGSQQLSDLPVTPEERYAKHQEFWINIGRELVGIAAEHGCAEMANHTLYSVLNFYETAAVAAGVTQSMYSSNNTLPSPVQRSAPPSVRSPDTSCQGPVVIDMRLFIDKVVNPVSSEIARMS